MEEKFNSHIIGVAIGLLTTIIVFLVFYFTYFKTYPVNDFLIAVLHNKKILAPMISLAGVPNLGIFFLFLNKNKYKSARGIIIATFALVLIVLFIKILM